MTLFKSLLLGSAAGIVAVAGAQAADLPSKKAAPATYVKICDAYGAGFFYIPGTDTCAKISGYTRYELQYTPAKQVLKLTNTAGAATIGVGQFASTQDTFGSEYRGRIDLDARTPTGYGVARSYIALRGTGATGLRKAAANYETGSFGNVVDSANGSITMERAFVQWAGFTVGISSSNYAMMPSWTYNANLWAGFPNGQRQIAYTATLGGGFSATIALEDKSMFNGDAGSTSVSNVDTANVLVANVRLDQAWGWAAVHGVVGKNSITNATTGTTASFGPLSYAASTTVTGTTDLAAKSKNEYAIGATASFNLDMIAKGDVINLTANYADGMVGALMANGIGNPNVGSSGGRTLGGVLRNDNNVVYLGTAAAGFANTKGWNVGAQALHYWAPNWRSVFTGGYAQLTPPTQVQTATLAWGKGTIWETRGSLIYSPVKSFDIGLEVQYLKNNSKLQNLASDLSTAAGTWKAAGYNGLSNSNLTTKLRVERSF